jgi:branched-chain amino acid transport system substrate-binding protein
VRVFRQFGAHGEEASVKIPVLTAMLSFYADIGGDGSRSRGRRSSEQAQYWFNHISRKWHPDEGVDLITDVPTSSVALAVEDVSRDLHKLALFTGAGSSDITGKKCSPSAAHGAYDTYALAHGAGSAIVTQGGKTCYLHPSPPTTRLATASGGMRQALVPLGTADFSSNLLQAQIVGLANADQDTTNAIMQSAEFGIQHARSRRAYWFSSPMWPVLDCRQRSDLQLTSAFYRARTTRRALAGAFLCRNTACRR